MAEKKVAVVMGSESDFETVKKCVKILKNFEIEVEMHVLSAHRSPDQTSGFAANAAINNFGVIIAAAGKAAHLAGAIAANTILPVIGIPIKSSALDGLDALLSTVQMPKGVPVATVAIDGAENAAYLAIQILAISDMNLKVRLMQFKKEQTNELIKVDSRVNKMISTI